MCNDLDKMATHDEKKYAHIRIRDKKSGSIYGAGGVKGHSYFQMSVNGHAYFPMSYYPVNETLEQQQKQATMDGREEAAISTTTT